MSPPRVMFFENTAVQVVGYSKASFPASGTTSGGIGLVIPHPTGILPGDLLIAFMNAVVNGTFPPAGWISRFAFGNLAIWSNTVQSGDPIETTWFTNSNASRTGAMIALRGGTYNPSGSFVASDTMGAVTALTPGAALVIWMINSGGTLNENLTANSPLVMGTQHKHRGTAGGAIILGTGIAAETNLNPGIISGRSWNDPDGGTEVTVAVIVEVG